MKINLDLSKKYNFLRFLGYESDYSDQSNIFKRYKGKIRFDGYC